jgi:hypothetical protein
VKKHLFRLTGLLLFVVFLSGIMPKEYLHDMLFDHTDEVHPIYKKGEVVITNKHNHCSFLSFEFAPFVRTESQVFRVLEQAVYTIFGLPVYTDTYTASFPVFLLRGPPATIFRNKISC